MSACHTGRTFVVHPQVVLGQPDVAELVLRAPGARQRALGLVDGRVEPSEPLVELLLLLVQSRVPVDDNRHEEAAARRLSRHGHDTGVDTNGLSVTRQIHLCQSVSSLLRRRRRRRGGEEGGGGGGGGVAKLASRLS